VETCQLPIASLAPGDSPRLSGELSEHVQLLAESSGPLPPILVHRQRMRVIDGMHRLEAAILRGDDTIEAQFFDGNDADAFLTAVRLNVEHGLPLTRADREAAASRIVASHPQYSNRAIGAIAGLAPRTVASIRHRTGHGVETDVPARIGRDGRMRPLNSARARLVASEVITQQPNASLRQVADLVGLSPATVRDVRERMRRGDDPVPDRERRTDRRRVGQEDPRKPRRATAEPARDSRTILYNLSRDPSLRLSESGRLALRWLFARASGLEDGSQLVAGIPPHSVYVVLELARACAAEWLRIADLLERQLRNTA
jgi:ParB-like chromosome segregation protein Spo0J